MKEGWSYKKLGEVARVIHGKNQKEVLSANGQYPIYGSGGTIMGYANDFLCEARTTILGRKGSINNPQFIEERFWNVDTAFGITALPGNNSKFIYYFIKSIDWSKKNTGTTLPSLTQQVVISVEIPVPPLSEQHSIVTRLDTAFSHIDALKANAEKQLNEARKLFQAELTECMKPKEGWEEDMLINVFKFIDYRGATPTKLHKGIPLVTAKNVKYGYIDYTIKDYISIEEYETRKGRGVSHKGDLLFTTEAPLGNVAIANLEEFSAGQRLITLQQYDIPKHAFINKYYFYYMLCSDFQMRIKNLATGATAQGIKAKVLKTILVPIVPLSEQQAIVTHLDSLSSNIRKLEELQQKTIAECDALKQAMLREVFE